MLKQIDESEPKIPLCCRICLGTVVYLSIVLLLLFSLIFIIVPMTFKYSKGIQTGIIFPTWYIERKNYGNIEAFGINGVNNFYINVDKKNNVELGIWQILPEEILSEFVKNDNYNYEKALNNNRYNILLYMHGNGADRTESLELYQILRKHFHIFAVDYRGYADSTKADMNENNIVADMVNIYKWLRERTKANIFIWGHSLGTAVGTHLVANLNAQNYTPTGLVLETPFTSVTDVMKEHTIIKLFSWLPWFESTFLDPIVENGLDFSSKTYIVDVNCPILMLHAKDDTIIPYHFADDLYDIAIKQRNYTFQGNITYHLFEALGYNHMYIFSAPELPKLVKNFIEESLKFLNRTIF